MATKHEQPLCCPARLPQPIDRGLYDHGLAILEDLAHDRSKVELYEYAQDCVRALAEALDRNGPLSS